MAIVLTTDQVVTVAIAAGRN